MSRRGILSGSPDGAVLFPQLTEYAGLAEAHSLRCPYTNASANGERRCITLQQQQAEWIFDNEFVPAPDPPNTVEGMHYGPIKEKGMCVRHAVWMRARVKEGVYVSMREGDNETVLSSTTPDYYMSAARFCNTLPVENWERGNLGPEVAEHTTPPVVWHNDQGGVVLDLNPVRGFHESYDLQGCMSSIITDDIMPQLAEAISDDMPDIACHIHTVVVTMDVRRFRQRFRSWRMLHRWDGTWIGPFFVGPMNRFSDPSYVQWTAYALLNDRCNRPEVPSPEPTSGCLPPRHGHP